MTMITRTREHFYNAALLVLICALTALLSGQVSLAKEQFESERSIVEWACTRLIETVENVCARQDGAQECIRLKATSDYGGCVR